MNNIKRVAQGFALLVLLLGVAIATEVYADNDKDSKIFSSARASLKADALVSLESSTGVVVGQNGTLRVIGAKVTSVSNGDISVLASFGNSSLSFIAKVDASTKLNGKVLGSEYASAISSLDAGDKISFSGTITSSTVSSIVVNVDHLVSRALFTTNNIEGKTSFKGEVEAVNVLDNSFTVDLRNGRTIKVTVSNSTVITVDGAVKTLSSVKEDDEVKITGELNTSGSVVTASKVVVVSDDENDDEGDKDRKGKGENNEKKGGWFGKIMNWFWK